MKTSINNVKTFKETHAKYLESGYTKAAFNDTNWMIRLTAFKRLGFTVQSLFDSSESIRKEAARFFGLNP